LNANPIKPETKTLGVAFPSGLPNSFAVSTLFLDSSLLTQAKKIYQSNERNGLFVPEITKLIQEANTYLRVRPPSVMDKAVMPPNVTKHDYLSLTPYRWPNPDTPNGLPYLFRDGETNPEVHLISDKDNMDKMVIMAKVLSLAYFFTDDSKYAAKVQELLRVWFLNEDTRMNPNLEYSELIRGISKVNPSGVIAGGYLTNLFDVIPIMEKSSTWTRQDKEGMEKWFGQYLDWLLHSKAGTIESLKLNNHGTYYYVQVTSIALFLNKTDIVKKILQQTMQDPSTATFSDVPKLISFKIFADGRQPFELSRTKSLDYSLFNLLGLFKLAIIGEHVGINLWNYKTADGGGLRKALDHLIPYALGEKDWPYEQLKSFQKEYLADLLCQASIRYKSDNKYQSYLSYYESLNSVEKPMNKGKYGICVAGQLITDSTFRYY